MNVGTFDIGSLPGEPGRAPSREPSLQKIKLGPFRMDVYPYPGDPTKPPRTGVSQGEAAVLCAQKKGRLCTEIEWERACRGPESSIYPGGEKPCPPSDPLCLSNFDVAQLTTLPEWTASQFGKGSTLIGKNVVKGSQKSSGAPVKRCAARHDAKGVKDIGFRCCYGAPNAASFKEPSLGVAYTEVDFPLKKLTKLLLGDPRTKYLASNVHYFKPEAARTVLARGPGETKGFHLTTRPVKWQPARGSQFLVLSARSGKDTSFVLTYFISGDKKTLAGSFVMKNEPGPIALAYAPSIRPRIHFSGCWGCPGETGKVLFRKPEEIVMLQP